MTEIPWNQIIISVSFLSILGIILSLILILAEKKIMNYGICNVEINNGEKILNVRGGDSLLATLAENEIFLPSACGGRGSCAYCKVQVHNGGGITGPVELPYLTDEELKKNIRLSCQVKIRTAISVTVPKELFSVKKYKGLVEHKIDLTHDIISLKIRLVAPESISFTAGQYVQIESRKYKGRESVNRAYSISSIPSENNSVELIIRKVPDGICTTWVFDYLNQGDEISLSGPYGDFRLQNTDRPVIFIAGGSGMAPIWSILREMEERKTERKSYYFFGALTQKDLFYTEELREMEKLLYDFKYIPALSNEPDLSGWTGERGLVTSCINKYIPDISGFEAYLCGSPGMIDSCIRVLTEGGMTEDRIFYDKFA